MTTRREKSALTSIGRFSWVCFAATRQRWQQRYRLRLGHLTFQLRGLIDSHVRLGNEEWLELADHVIGEKVARQIGFRAVHAVEAVENLYVLFANQKVLRRRACDCVEEWRLVVPIDLGRCCAICFHDFEGNLQIDHSISPCPTI